MHSSVVAVSSVSAIEAVYPDPIPTTTSASVELNSQQISYLIAIAHPNITVHFFASFLMRDHCLALIEGLLRKRREASPQWVAAQAVAANTQRLSEEARARHMVQALAAKKLSEHTAFPTAPTSLPEDLVSAAVAEQAALHGGNPPPAASDKEKNSYMKGSSAPESPIAISTESSSTFVASPSLGSATAAHLTELEGSPSAVSSSSSAAGGASSSAGGSHASDESSGLSDPPHPHKGQRRKSSGSSSAVVSAFANLPKYHSHPRLNFGDAVPPADDFLKVEWDDLVDTTVSGVNARLFFALFLSDTAIWSTKEYALASGKGDTEWKMSNWFDPKTGAAAFAPHSLVVQETQQRGPLVRDMSYNKLLTGSPLGPSATRVHQECTYTSSKSSSLKLETRNTTPDVPFADCIHVLERTEIDDTANGNSVRIRVRVFVRFTKQPWKMKMFIGLIKSKTKEDVQAWYREWIISIQKFMLKHPAVITAAIARANGATSVEEIASGTPSSATPSSSFSSSSVHAAGEESSAAIEGEDSTSSKADGDAASGIGGGLDEMKSNDDVDSSAFDESITGSAASQSITAPVPLIEWGWLRSGLSMLPVETAHVDTVMSIVLQMRESVRDYRQSEIVFGFLMLWAALAFTQRQMSTHGFFSFFFPWRWISIVLSASPGLLVGAAALALLWSHRRSNRDAQTTLTRILLAQQQLNRQQKRVEQQMDAMQKIMMEIQAQNRKQKGGTMHVNEHHF